MKDGRSKRERERGRKWTLVFSKACCICENQFFNTACSRFHGCTDHIKLYTVTMCTTGMLIDKWMDDLTNSSKLFFMPSENTTFDC